MVDKVEKILEEADREQLVLDQRIEELREEMQRLVKENDQLGKMNEAIRGKVAEGKAQVKKID